jgi:hypothetical protein
MLLAFVTTALLPVHTACPSGQSTPDAKSGLDSRIILDSRIAGDATHRDGVAARDTGPCPRGAPTPVGRICVSGASTRNPTQIVENQPIRVVLYPKGCYSSSCTAVRTASCAVTPGGATLPVTGRFCLEPPGSPGGGCTADCGGGGFAECSSGALTAGSYTATVDQLTVSFTVPSTIATGELCVGDQF